MKRSMIEIENKIKGGWITNYLLWRDVSINRDMDRFWLKVKKLGYWKFDSNCYVNKKGNILRVIVKNDTYGTDYQIEDYCIDGHRFAKEDWK